MEMEHIVDLEKIWYLKHEIVFEYCICIQLWADFYFREWHIKIGVLKLSNQICFCFWYQRFSNVEMILNSEWFYASFEESDERCGSANAANRKSSQIKSTEEARKTNRELQR